MSLLLEKRTPLESALIDMEDILKNETPTVLDITNALKRLCNIQPIGTISDWKQNSYSRVLRFIGTVPPQETAKRNILSRMSSFGFNIEKGKQQIRQSLSLELAEDWNFQFQDQINFINNQDISLAFKYLNIEGGQGQIVLIKKILKALVLNPTLIEPFKISENLIAWKQIYTNAHQNTSKFTPAEESLLESILSNLNGIPGFQEYINKYENEVIQRLQEQRLKQGPTTSLLSSSPTDIITLPGATVDESKILYGGVKKKRKTRKATRRRLSRHRRLSHRRRVTRGRHRR